MRSGSSDGDVSEFDEEIGFGKGFKNETETYVEARVSFTNAATIARNAYIVSAESKKKIG